MTYPETVKYLESFINYEKTTAYRYKESLGLTRIKEFLTLLGNPQDDLKCIHVAGTKGKGSICAFIAYILKEAGFKVGLYTSPHLLDFRERIRILNPLSDKRQALSEFEGIIPKAALKAIVERLRPKIGKYGRSSPYGPLTFFEAYTALALVYFKEKKVDFAVLETGLGGRLDATNVVNALVSVITPISYDHMDKLGHTLKKIAKEKAGIIKTKKSIAISAPQEKEAREVIRARCKAFDVKLYEVNKYKKLKLRLLGRHQLINAAVAISAVKALNGYGIRVGVDSLMRGLYNTLWPGRCEVISRNPLVVLDGAQNVASVKALKEAIRKNFSAAGGSAFGEKYKKMILVLGISNDKDIKGICSELYDLADKVILTKANSLRAADPKILAGYFNGKERYITDGVGPAKNLSRRLAERGDLILVTGSLFVVGEFKYGRRQFN